MASFAQTPDGNIALVGGRPSLIRGAEEKAQKVRNRLKLFRGEWFLDQRIGTPWFQVVFGAKNPDLEIVKRLFARVILSVTGIVEVQEISVSFDAKTRELSYEWRALDEEGNEINGASETPFVVEVS